MKHSLFGKIKAVSAIRDRLKNVQLSIAKSFGNKKTTTDKFKNHKVKQTALCVVPLPYFTSYHSFTDISSNSTIMVSSFLEIVTNLNDNSLFGQGEIFLEALLNYKWNHFVRYRFYFVFFLQLLYYICFSVGVSFAREVFKYQDVTESLTINVGHMVCICLFFLIAFILAVQEVRQLWKLQNWINYFKSVYNWMDIAALALPVTTFILLITNHDAFVSIFFVHDITH
jgi:hypothetical protein